MSTPGQYLTSRPLPIGDMSLPIANFDPMFGVNPYGLPGQNMYLASDPYPDYAVLRAQRTQQQSMMFQQAAAMRAASMFTGTNLSDLTPHQWTPDEAVDQTSLALAKLSSVNPELAQQLAAKRAAAPEQNKGFIEDLFGAIGGVVKGGLAAGGKLLELISGSSYIVPNLFYDAIDGGDFNPLEDITGGFTNERRHNWNSVFQQMGWEGDGISGALRAIAGFAGDVLTDPLTYALAGFTVTDEAALLVGKTAALKNVSFLDEAAKVMPKDIGMTSAEWLKLQIGRLTGETMTDWTRLTKQFGGKDFDQRITLLRAMEFNEAQSKLLARTYETIDKLFDATRTGNIGKVLKTGYVRLADGELMPVTRDVFEQVVRAGTDRAGYSAAKAMATALPGLRFRFAVPWTDLRFISPAIPYSAAVGNAFNGARKFVAGQTGMGRLMTLIQHGEADWAALDHWMQHGWASFKNTYPELVGKFKGYNRLGGGLFAFSEQAGKLTAHFSASNAAARQGLTSYLSFREGRRISEHMRAFVHDVGWGGYIEDESGKLVERVNRRALAQDAKDIGIPFGGPITMPDEQQIDMIRYMELPDDLSLAAAENFDQLEPELIARWLDPAVERAATIESEADLAAFIRAFGNSQTTSVDEVLAMRRQRVDDALALVERMPRSHMNVADKFRSIQDYMHTQLGEVGHGLGNVKTNFNLVNRIRSSQVHQFLYGREYTFWPNAEKPWGWVHSNSTAANMESDLLGGAQQHARSNGFAHGVELHVVPNANPGFSGASQAVGRWNRTLVLDTDAEMNNNIEVINKIVAELEKVGDVTEQAIQGIKRHNIEGGILSTAEADAFRAQLVTDTLQKQGYDAIEFRVRGEARSVLVLDPNNVKIIDDSADTIIQPMTRGYAPRVLLPKIREWVRGNVSAADRRVLWAVPNLEADLSRATIDMTWEEANVYIRDELKRRFADAGERALAQLDEIPYLLEINPVLAHLQYVEKMGMALGSSLVDDYMRRLINLGNVAPALFDNPARGNRYEFLVNATILTSLARTDKKLAKGVEEMAVRVSRFYEEQHRSAAELGQRYGDMLTTMVDGLGNGEPILERHILALRRWASLYGDVGKYIGESKDAVRLRLRELQNERDLWEKAQREAERLAVILPNGQKALPHVSAAEGVRATVLKPEEGLVRFEGWHGSFYNEVDDGFGSYMTVGLQDVTTQVAETGGDFSGYATGALHVGTYEASRDRVAQLVENYYDEMGTNYIMGMKAITDAEGNIIRPALPPTAIVFENRKTGEKVVSVVQSMPSTRYGKPSVVQEPRSVGLMIQDAYQQILDRADATGVDLISEEDLIAMGEDVRVRYRSYGKADEAKTAASWSNSPWIGGTEWRFVESRPASWDEIGDITDDLDMMFETIDDYIHPVSFEGRVPPENITPDGKILGIQEQNLNPLFTSGVRGESGVPLSKAQTKRKVGYSPAELQASGYDAIVYENQFENVGSLSIAVVYGKKMVQSDLTTGLEQLAERQMLYVMPDGRFVSKRGNFLRGGQAKPLRPLSTIDDDILKLRQESEILRAAEREMKSKRGKGVAAMRVILGDENAMQQAATRAGETMTGVAKRIGKREATIARKLEKLSRQMTLAEKEMNKIYAEAQGAVAGLRPAIVRIPGDRGGMIGLASLTVPGLQGYAAPEFIARELNQLFETKKISELRQLWREFILGPWKRWATYRWPGFHIRNIMGAWFNNLLGGVGAIDYRFAERMRPSSKWFSRAIEADDWARMNLEVMFPSELNGKLTYSQLAHYLADDGVGRANSLTVLTAANAVDDLQEAAGLPKKVRGAIGTKARAFDEFMQNNIGGGVEDFFRMAAWSRGMAATAGDRFGARAFVMVRHGDYSDLTDVESVVRDMIPFYKWMRTNIPYQIRSMFEQPGVYANIIKSEQAVTEAEGVDYQSAQAMMPQWMKEAYAVPMPEVLDNMTKRIPGFDLLFGGGARRNDGMKFLVFDLPYKDLYMGLMDYMSAGFPVIRNVVESYGFEQQLFSGRPLKGEYIKAAGWLQPFLPALSKMTSFAGTQFIRKGTDGWYIQDKFENVLTAWPVYSKFRNWVVDSEDQNRYVQRMSILTSALLGISIRPADYTAAELDFYYNEVLPVLDQYRSLGVEFPTAQDFQSAEAASAFGMMSTSYGLQEDSTGLVTGITKQ